MFLRTLPADPGGCGRDGGGAPLSARAQSLEGNPGPSRRPAPTYRVGDRWVYHVEDGFRQRFSWDETHEIVSIEPNLITVSG